MTWLGKLLTVLWGGVARTLTARYFKNSVANFLRHDGMGNTGVMVIYGKKGKNTSISSRRE